MTVNPKKDIIEIEEVTSLYGLFLERVRRSPDAVAYRYFDPHNHQWQDISWSAMAEKLAGWQAALEKEGLSVGDRVAVMMNSCIEWVLFEQAALSLGLVVIPLYTNDRADNVGYIIQDSDVKILLIEGHEQWEGIKAAKQTLLTLKRLIIKNPLETDLSNSTTLADWAVGAGELKPARDVMNELATIVYTSGTTGRPKGVMLSHRNILWNARASLKAADIYPSDVFLSFLPLSHTFERTIGYYLAMMSGSTVAYARSIAHLAEDLITTKPTVIISVPRIFERVLLKVKTKLAEQGGFARFMFRAAVNIGWRRFQYQQNRGRWCPSFLLWPVLKKLVADKLLDKLGGQIRVAVCGGAPLSEDVAKVFIGLGLPMIQGYGLTETSPVIGVNRLEDNVPASVGLPLEGVEVKIDDKEQLLTRSPSVMMGYWNNIQATEEIMDQEGWLNTGDKARIEGGHIFITGRTKDIIVLANGEKVPPADMEAAIAMDALFEQVLVLGEGKPYLSAIVVLNSEQKKNFLKSFADSSGNISKDKVKKALMTRVLAQLSDFPGYAQIRNLVVIDEPWTVENEMLTPTLKARRNVILKHYEKEVSDLYHGH